MFDGQNATDADSLYPQLWVGRVGSWCPSNGISGVTLYDYSGFNNHGTLNGSTADLAWTTSNGLAAYKSNATSDYMSMGSAIGSLVPASANAASVCAWLYKPSTTSTASIGFLDTNNHRFGIEATGGVTYFITENGSLTYPNVADTKTGWNFYVMTYGGSASAGYINGVKQTLTAAGTVPATLAITGAFCAGRVLGNSTYNSSGVLTDDIALFSRALNIDEILTLYSNGYGRGIAYTPDIAPNYSASSANRRLLSLRRKAVAA